MSGYSQRGKGSVDCWNCDDKSWVEHISGLCEQCREVLTNV